MKRVLNYIQVWKEISKLYKRMKRVLNCIHVWREFYTLWLNVSECIFTTNVTDKS